jgi:hypothetical protein
MRDCKRLRDIEPHNVQMTDCKSVAEMRGDILVCVSILCALAYSVYVSIICVSILGAC